MFELSLSNHLSSDFLINATSRKFFDAELHERVTYSDRNITINGIKYKGEKDSFFETDEHVIFTLGQIFQQFLHAKDNKALHAEEVLRQYLGDGRAFVKKLKGNFIILIYLKSERAFLIFKDQLGLKYLYYNTDKEKFYISTNLNDFKNSKYELNYSAILEKVVFNYPISQNSFIEGVVMLDQGEILEYDGLKIITEYYFKIEELFENEELFDFDETKFLELFEKSVLLRAGVSENLLASLTGGFDGRANIAVLLKNKIKFKAYSFGKIGGENTRVPLTVSKKLKIDYSPVYLEDDFEKEYSKCALSAINLSDGISIFERANYIYSSKKTSSFCNYNLTGLIGGEVFAPVHEKTDYINENYYNILYTQSSFDIKSLLAKANISDFINIEFLLGKEIVSRFNDNVNSRQKKIRDWKSQKYWWMYYMKDMMSLGFRHFYGNQMHLERYYSENLSPYYDLDLMRYIFSTKHLVTYKNAFKNSVWLRRKNRKLQSLVIKNQFPKLGEIPVDRGYPPNYNLDYRRILIPYYFFERRMMNKTSLPDFDSKKWCDILYKEVGDEIELNEKICRPELIKSFMKNYKKENHNKSFNNLLSVLIWCSNKDVVKV